MRPLDANPTLPRRLAAAAALSAALASAAAAGPAPAHAAAPWSPPTPVQGAPATAPALAFNAAGLGVLAADTGGGASTGAVGPHTVGALVDESDAFPGPVTQLTATNLPLGPRFALYGLGRFVGLGTHFSRGSGRAAIAFAQAGGKLTNPHFLGPTDRAGQAEAIAANARGDVAASFGVCANRACVHQSLYLVVRRAGRPPNRSLRVDNVAVRNISTVAVNARGDMLIAWQANGGVFARIRTAGGTLYRTERLGNPGEPVRSISAVLTAARAAAVAWEAQDVNEGAPGSAAIVDATFKAAGGRHHFHSQQRLATVPALATGHYVAERGVKVVLAPDGRITATWTGYDDGRFVVAASDLAGFRFGAGRTLSDPAVDSSLSDADSGPDSGVAVAWRTGVAGADTGAGPTGLSAAVRPPGAPGFGAAEQIEQGTLALDAVLRFDPSTGRVVAAWNDLQAIRTSARDPLPRPGA
jgi:hypothetical protein